MRTQITIPTKHDRFFVSILEIKEPGYYTKEVALVEETPRGFMSCECVPLWKWFSDTADDGETTINITNYEQWGIEPCETELSFIAHILESANQYSVDVLYEELRKEVK